MRKKIAFLSVLLVAALLLGMVPLGAFRTEAYAATETKTSNDPAVKGSKTANKTALTPEDREVEITLSLPSAEYKNEIDIVFVMDDSSSTKNGNFPTHVKNLFEKIIEKNKDIIINVGVVKFTGKATNMLGDGMIPYDKNDSTILDAIKNTDVPGSGSNVHSGLMMADELLKSSDLPDSNKYVVLLTDGRSYIWNDEDGNPTTYYTQWYGNGPAPTTYRTFQGNPTISQSAGERNKEDYSVDVIDPTGKSKLFYFDNYQDLFDSTDSELTGDTGYEEYAVYADGWKLMNPDNKGVLPGETVPHTVTSGAAIFLNFPGIASEYLGHYTVFWEYIPPTDWEGVKYYEANPYVAKPVLDENGDVVNDENKVALYYFTDEINDAYYQYHVDNMQKGTYIAGHKWDEMNTKYNCAAMTFWGSSGAGLKLAKSFNEWLVNTSKYGAKVGEASVDEMFDDIKDDILYMVDSGTVHDPIPEEFELKETEGECPFTIETERDKKLTATQVEGLWMFGDPDEGIYPYEVSYDPESREITWVINVPVENANKVSLTYTLTINKETAANLDPGYDTNGKTTLVYKSTSDGPNDQAHNYDFTVPKVTYTKPADVTINHYLEGYVPEDVTDPETDPTTNDNTSDNTSGNENPVPTEPGTTNGTSSRSSLSLVGLAVTFTSTDASDYGLYKTETASGNVGEEYTAEQLKDLPEGYHFDETVTKELGAKSGTITEKGLELNLYYSLNTHTVTYEYTGEYPEDVLPVPDPVDYKFGATVPAAEVPTYEGWTFNGWNGEVTTMPDEDVLVTGSWTVNPGDKGGGTPTRYTVTYEYTGDVPSGAPSVPASKTYAVGASVPAAKVPSMDGYTFSGWSGEVSTMPNHDVTVTGSWTADEPIDDPDTPLAPPTDDETDIDDPDTPLAPGTVDEETEIDDEETPLSPFTGDDRHTGLWAGISIASLAGIALLSKRRRKPAKH